MPAELKQVDGGAVVDPVIGRLAGIGQPAPPTRGFQAHLITHNAFPGRAGGDALGQGGYADADFHIGVKLPGGLNSRVVPRASQTARPSRAPLHRSIMFIRLFIKSIELGLEFFERKNVLRVKPKPHESRCREGNFEFLGP